MQRFHREAGQTKQSRLMRWHAMALALLSASGSQAAAFAPAEWSVPSPDSRVVLTVRLVEASGRTGGKLAYTVACDGSIVLDASPLGIVRDDAAFEDALALESAGPATVYESTYTVLRGKRRDVHERYRQLVLTFRNSSGERVELHLRAYDDGAAFRYRFPDCGYCLRPQGTTPRDASFRTRKVDNAVL